MGWLRNRGWIRWPSVPPSPKLQGVCGRSRCERCSWHPPASAACCQLVSLCALSAESSPARTLCHHLHLSKCPHPEGEQKGQLEPDPPPFVPPCASCIPSISGCLPSCSSKLDDSQRLGAVPNSWNALSWATHLPWYVPSTPWSSPSARLARPRLELPRASSGVFPMGHFCLSFCPIRLPEWHRQWQLCRNGGEIRSLWTT